jgi:hypothetical protein
LEFWIRGSLSSQTVLRVEGPAPEVPAANPFCSAGTGCLEIASLSGDWQHVSVDIPSANFSDVKSFLTITFQYNQAGRTTAAGNGGEVFLDDIRYVR